MAYTEQGPTRLPVNDDGDDERGEGPEAMDEEQFASAVKSALDDAVDYIDGTIAPIRAKATEYYRGDKFGNEEPGRSQFVMTEVRDTVLAMLPSLLRIFCSSEQAVSYEPRTAQAVDMAEQATDYCNYIVFNDNDGFSILYNAMKDALIRKSGVLKWRWDDDIEIAEFSFTGLSDGQMQLLSQDPEVEILEQSSRPMPENWQVLSGMPPQQPQMPGAAGMQPGAPQAAAGAAPPLDPSQAPAVSPPGAMPGMPMQAPAPPPQQHDVKVRRRRKKQRVKIECVPVEELLVSRNGRDLDTSPLVAHRSLKTFSDLVKMGYDPEQLEELAGSDTFMFNLEAVARNPAINTFMQHLETNDESARLVVYNEVYIQIDKDGDGIAELRKVCMAGITVLHDEVVEGVPIAILCPDPEPHCIIGNSVADQTMDIQLLKSSVVRNVMDSLAQSIHPRTVVVEGQVSIDDVLNVETGAIIRARAPGMVQPFEQAFVGQAAMPIIAWLDEVKAKRTGVVPASAGLDPDVLQSTTKSGVDATIQGAQERTEMTARLFAEGGIKRMMKGILKLICRHQDQPRMVRLRGKWVEADPRSWDAEMDVIVHVALGRGTDQDRLMALNGIAAKQEAAIQMAGLTNPLADLGKYRNTLAKMTEILGFKNVDEFFSPINMQAIAQHQAQQPPKQDPNTMVAEAQQQKVQAGIQIDQAKLQHDQERLQFEQQQAAVEVQHKERQQEIDAALKREEMAMKDARDREQMRLDAVIRLQGLELQYGTQVRSADTEAELEQARLLQGIVMHRETLNRDEEQHAMKVEADVHKHSMTVEQKAEAARLMAEAKRSQTNGGA